MLGHKATLSDLICRRDEILADCRVVSTPQVDSIEVFEDNSYNSDQKMKSLCELNSGFRRVEPETYQEGLPEQFNSIDNEKLDDFKYRCFNPYNGLFTVKHWNSGETYHIEHNFDSERIPVGAFANINQLGCNVNKLNICNRLLDTVWGIQANMATQVNRYPIQPPKIVFFRFAPFYTATGKAQRRAQFKCTYETPIEFYFSPHVGIEMFQSGSQPDVWAYAKEDPFDQCSAAVERFNWCVRPEDFVMPMTGYVMTENQVDSRYNERPVHDDSDRDEVKRKVDEVKRKVFSYRVKKAVTDAGYTVRKKEKNDGTALVTTVESAASIADDNQLPPTYSAKVLEHDEITDLYATLDYQPPVNEKAYHVREEQDPKGTGLVVDIHDKPLLPVTVEPTEDYDKMAVSMGIRFYRPAEAWKKIGYEKPPVWTRGNKRHIPWPKLGPYGTVMKKTNLCQIYDLDIWLRN